MKILVIGAGVSGLSSALVLRKAGHNVDIWAKDLPENTTSAVAAALWYPYLCNPKEKAVAWSRQTLEYLRDTAANDTASGVRPVTLYKYLDEMHGEPWWKDAVESYGEIEASELPKDYRYGWWMKTYLMDSSRYLPWLVTQLAELGVNIQQRIVESFDIVPSEYEVIVNCSGLGARELCQDDRLYPVRGQALRVRQNGSIDVRGDDEGHNKLANIIPRFDDILLGGTAQANDWRLEPDPKDTEEILRKVGLISTDFENPKILQVKVGLRPARDTVRLELEQRNGRNIVHNYGHGGAGYTLSRGCAEEVLGIVRSLTS